MENFIVSARKYRPAHFNTVVGQAHITQTLKNAIKTGQLAQAFLFCGPRGVGKTTCARILAKAINCQNVTPEFEACEQCESCLSFRNGTSMNIHELDAASNNSVDDIRSLVEQVRYPPQAGKYKIYIIDEVHMLSQSAFNAFLKTLEEPPAYAIFILATTEKHKIIPTILSRCQIFDFNRIQVSDIARHLEFIARQESIPYETDGLHIIAQKADGALRDALSMFDQLVSFSGGELSYKAVIDNLNILDYDYYFRVTDLLLEENIPRSLLLFNEVLEKGFDGNHFVNGLCSHFRNLLVCKDERTVQLLEVSEGIRQRYLEQSGAADTGFLLAALNIGNQCDIQYKQSKNQRLQVELALMKMCHIRAAVTLAASGRGSGQQRRPTAAAGGETQPPQATAPGSSGIRPQPGTAGVGGTAATGSAEAEKKKRTEPVDQQQKEAAAVPSSSGTRQHTAAPPVGRETQPEQPEETKQPEAGGLRPAGSTEPVPAGEQQETQTGKPTGQAAERKTSLPTGEAKNTGAAGAWGLKIPSLHQPAKAAEEESFPGAQPDKKGAVDLPESEFTQEQLMAYWEKFAEEVQAKGRPNLYALLTANTPVLQENYQIELKIANKVQQEKLQEEKGNLLGYLRKRLNNFRIDIHTVIAEEPDQRRRLYTPTDKFNYLAEKNPSLIELKKRLDLDID